MLIIISSIKRFIYHKPIYIHIELHYNVITLDQSRGEQWGQRKKSIVSMQSNGNVDGFRYAVSCLFDIFC